MSTFNKVIIMGNLTADPELRATKSGKSVAQFTIALNRKYGSGDEQREETSFIDVILWERLAELAQRYLNKGRSVLVEGRLQQDTWQDKQSGQKRSKIRVVAERLEFVGEREAEEIAA